MPTLPPATEREWTVLGLLRWAAAYLEQRGVESPRASAEILLAHALRTERVQLYVQHDKPLAKGELAAFKELLLRRARREPVAYIVGRKGFWTLDLAVAPEVLIPRPETECLVEAALAVLAESAPAAGARILDLGTGSGAIVLALASAAPNQLYLATDISPAALATARRNARAAGLAGRVRFAATDWLAGLKPQAALFDLIVSNPPYVETAVLASLQEEIVRYEPAAALDGGPDGLACLRIILAGAHGFLKPGGALLLEIGCDQKEAVRRIAEAVGGYAGYDCLKDLSGRDRVAAMRKKNIANAPDGCY